MSTIKKTGSPRPPPSTSKPSRAAGCGPATPTQRAMEACGGGWVSKSKGKAKAEKAATGSGCGGWGASTKKSTSTASACGGAGWTRYGRVPSGC